MENYEDFILRYTSGPADDDDDEESVSKPSSMILFHGVSVLPPLLSEQQRDEMRLLRETAVNEIKMRRQTTSDGIKDETVTADVQITSTEQQTSDDIAQSQEIITFPPLTSTVHDAKPSNHLRASPVDEIPDVFDGTGTARDHSDKHPHSDISHQMMMSSGYVTNENTHVTCDDSSWAESNRTSAGFCLNITRSPGTGSDIISHVPVDGSALEEENTSLEEANEEPYRMSLQNLLKKSQDYRRRQRLLRSQAQGFESTDEHGLSDKENQEFLPDQILRSELRNARERRKVTLQLPDSETSHTEISDTPPEDPEIDVSPQSTSAKSFYLSKQKPVTVCRSSTAGRKFTGVPAPTFCLSPVRSKKASGGVSAQKPLVKADSNNADDRVSLQQTQQITQLESNLSSLKALISDLESTLTLSHTDNSVCTLITHPAQTIIQNTIEHPTHPTGVLIDSSNHQKITDSQEKKNFSLNGSSLCQSYDVDAPSSLWTQLTPETGTNEGVSRAKRRLLMNEMSPERRTEKPRAVQTYSQPQSEDQVQVLLENESRRQQDLLQSLAVRYQLLRSVSFPRPSTGSRLEDTSTSSAFTSPSHTHDTSRKACLSITASCRPLLAAAVKGFLTRRLLRSERVSQLIRTIQDTQQFLCQMSVRGDFSSRQDLMLQDRVSLQLRAARYEFHNLMFNSSIQDHMKMIHQDRQVTRERRFRQHDSKVKGSLSAATRKALERKKLAMLQRKSINRLKFSPSGEESWILVPKICRVSKKTSPR